MQPAPRRSQQRRKHNHSRNAFREWLCLRLCWLRRGAGCMPARACPGYFFRRGAVATPAARRGEPARRGAQWRRDPRAPDGARANACGGRRAPVTARGEPASRFRPAQASRARLRGVVATPPSAPLPVRPASLPSPMFSGLCEELLRRPRPAAGSRPHLRCACHAHGVSREDCHAPPSPPAFFPRSAPRGFVRLPRAPLASCVFLRSAPKAATMAHGGRFT